MTNLTDDVPVTQVDEMLAEEIVSAANIVSYDGYYEIDIDAVSRVLARHRLTSQPAPGDLVVVTIGAGEIISNWGTYHDIPAVFLQPAPNGPGKLGESPNRDYPKDSVPPGTVILQFKGAPDVLLQDIASALSAAQQGQGKPADPDAVTGCADDFLPGSAEQWRDAAKAFAPTAPQPDRDGVLREALGTLRQREFQMMGAAISLRNWHKLEVAYNAARDRMDAEPIRPFIKKGEMSWSVTAAQTSTANNVAGASASATTTDQSAQSDAVGEDQFDWRKAAINLAMREQDYRLNHDVHGDGSREAGRSWDRMRHSGNAIRAAAIRNTTDTESGS